MCTINSDEHDAKHGVRNVREQPTATEQRDEPWAYYISIGQLRECKEGDVSGTGEKPVEMNMTDRYSCRQMVLAIGIMSDEKPISVSKSHFSDTPGKNDLANDPL